MTGCVSSITITSADRASDRIARCAETERKGTSQVREDVGAERGQEVGGELGPKQLVHLNMPLAPAGHLRDVSRAGPHAHTHARTHAYAHAHTTANLPEEERQGLGQDAVRAHQLQQLPA